MTARRPRRLRRLAIVALLLALVVGVVWQAPALVAGSALRSSLVNRYAGLRDAEVVVGAAELSWTGAVVAGDVVLVHRDGHRVARVGRMTLDRSPWQLLGGAAAGMTVAIDDAEVHARFGASKDDLREILAGYLQGPASENGETAVTVVVSDGRMTLENVDAGRSAVLTDVNAKVGVTPEGIAAALETGPAGERLHAEIAVRGDRSAADGTLTLTRWPLEKTEALVRLWDEQLMLAGVADGSLTFRWTDSPDGPPDVAARSTLTAETLTVRWQPLGPEPLTLGRIDLPLTLTTTDRLVVLDGSVLVDGVAVAADASLRREALTAGAATDTLVAATTGTVTLDADLAAVRTLAERFVALQRDVRIDGGRLSATVRLDGQDAPVTLVADVTGLNASRGGRPVAIDESLHLEASVLPKDDGSWTLQQLAAVAAGVDVRVSSPPVSRISGTIDLATLLDHAGRLVDLGPLAASGRLTVAGAVDRSAAGVTRLDGMHVDATDLRVLTPDWRIDEPRATLDLSGTLDHAGSFVATDVALRSSTVSLDTPQVTTSWRPALEAAGDVRFTADAPGLLAMGVAAYLPEGMEIGGLWQGTSRTRWDAQGLTAAVSAAGRDGSFRYGDFAWDEPQIALTGRCHLAGGGERFRLDDGHAATPTADLDVTVEVVDWSAGGRFAVTVDGTADMARLAPLLSASSGTPIAVTGRRPLRVTLSGPLDDVAGQSALVAYQGQFHAGWESVRTTGLVLGPASADARLADGWLVFQPIAGSLNGGALSATPAVRLAPEPCWLRLPAGPVLRDVPVTSAETDMLLDRVLPVLSGAADTDGLVSLNLEQFALSGNGLADADIRGNLRVHRMELTPGPVVAELARVLRLPPRVRLADESDVEFAVADGTVYHRNLKLAYPGLEVTLAGAVALDGRMNLTATFPLPDRLSALGSFGGSLAGQEVTLPIGGSLQQPRLDARGLQQATGRAVENAAVNALDGFLRKKLGVRPAAPKR